MFIPSVHVFFVSAAEFVYGRKMSSWWRGTLILIVYVDTDSDSDRSTVAYTSAGRNGDKDAMRDSRTANTPDERVRKGKEECFRCFSLEGNLKEGRNDAQTDDMGNDVIAKCHTYSLLDPRINTQGEKDCG